MSLVVSFSGLIWPWERERERERNQCIDGRDRIRDGEEMIEKNEKETASSYPPF